MKEDGNKDEHCNGEAYVGELNQLKSKLKGLKSAIRRHEKTSNASHSKRGETKQGLQFQNGVSGPRWKCNEARNQSFTPYDSTIQI